MAVLLKTYLSYALTGLILANVLLYFGLTSERESIRCSSEPIFTIPANFLLNKYWAFRNGKPLNRAGSGQEPQNDDVRCAPERRRKRKANIVLVQRLEGASDAVADYIVSYLQERNSRVFDTRRYGYLLMDSYIKHRNQKLSALP